MTTIIAFNQQIAIRRPCISSSQRVVKADVAVASVNFEVVSRHKLTSSQHILSTHPLKWSSTSSSIRHDKVITKAVSGFDEDKPNSGLLIDSNGKKAYTVGMADENGYGWAIAKSLAVAAGEMLIDSNFMEDELYIKVLCKLKSMADSEKVNLVIHAGRARVPILKPT